MGEFQKEYLSNNQLVGTAGNRAAAEVQLGIVRTVVVALQFLVGSERQHSEKQQSPVVNINGNSCHCAVR